MWWFCNCYYKAKLRCVPHKETYSLLATHTYLGTFSFRSIFPFSKIMLIPPISLQQNKREVWYYYLILGEVSDKMLLISYREIKEPWLELTGEPVTVGSTWCQGFKWLHILRVDISHLQRSISGICQSYFCTHSWLCPAHRKRRIKSRQLDCVAEPG